MEKKNCSTKLFPLTVLGGVDGWGSLGDWLWMNVSVCALVKHSRVHLLEIHGATGCVWFMHKHQLEWPETVWIGGHSRPKVHLPKNEMSIFLNNLDGKHQTLMVRPTLTLSATKRKVFKTRTNIVQKPHNFVS